MIWLAQFIYMMFKTEALQYSDFSSNLVFICFLSMMIVSARLLSVSRAIHSFIRDLFLHVCRILQQQWLMLLADQSQSGVRLLSTLWYVSLSPVAHSDNFFKLKNDFCCIWFAVVVFCFKVLCVVPLIWKTLFYLCFLTTKFCCLI